MTKTILLGMTAEEIVEKLKHATPQEVVEFNKLISSMDNYEEIKEELDAVILKHAKEELSEFMNSIQEDLEDIEDEDEKLFLNAFGTFVSGLAAVIDAIEETADKDEEEEQGLASILRAQMTKSKPTLGEQLKAQLEPKKPLTEILREQMQPKKTLAELLKEQVNTKASSVTKENILDKIIEQILEIESEKEEMVINHHFIKYGIAIGLMFEALCIENGVQYELDDKDIETVLTDVIDGLIQNGCEVNVRIEEGEVFTVIR